MEGIEQNKYEKEAQERWGNTDAYKESARRTRSYKADDWTAIKAESEAIEAGMAEIMQAGKPADSAEAMDQAEKARLYIDRWFYPCSHKMHAGLGAMYTADARFAAHYDERAEGLAAFVSAAIAANAQRNMA